MFIGALVFFFNGNDIVNNNAVDQKEKEDFYSGVTCTKIKVLLRNEPNSKTSKGKSTE